jgi:hypothetical protein
VAAQTASSPAQIGQAAPTAQTAPMVHTAHSAQTAASPQPLAAVSTAAIELPCVAAPC